MYNNNSPHTLMFELGNEYSKERWQQFEKISSFHKLTRHEEIKGYETNYHKIIEQYLAGGGNE